jgi:phenylacetate-CoA ligase
MPARQVTPNWASASFNRAERAVVARAKPFGVVAARHIPQYRVMRELSTESRSWSAERVAAHQEGALVKLIRRCWDDVPFYRALWSRHGAHIARFRGLEDLENLPVITKEMLASSGWLGLRGWGLSGTTGGTMGAPLRYRKSLLSVVRELAITDEWYESCGWSGGQSIVMRGGFASGASQIALSRPTGQRVVQTNGIDAARLDEVCDTIACEGIRVVVAYPSWARALAQHVELRDRRDAVATVSHVFTSSETLSSDAAARIREVLHCQVHDLYGQNESVVMLQRCDGVRFYRPVPHYGVLELHATADGEQDLRQVVGTGFINDMFPLVRYETGDVVRVERREQGVVCDGCSIVEVVGRTGDILHSADGTLYCPSVLEFATRYLAGTRDLLIAQTADDVLEIRYVSDADLAPSAQEELIRAMSERTGRRFTVKLRRVDSIGRGTSGKKRITADERSLENGQ